MASTTQHPAFLNQIISYEAAFPCDVSPISVRGPRRYIVAAGHLVAGPNSSTK
jgi:hypothetical protein